MRLSLVPERELPARPLTVVGAKVARDAIVAKQQKLTTCDLSECDYFYRRSESIWNDGQESEEGMVGSFGCSCMDWMMPCGKLGL